MQIQSSMMRYEQHWFCITWASHGIVHLLSHATEGAINFREPRHLLPPPKLSPSCITQPLDVPRLDERRLYGRRNNDTFLRISVHGLLLCNGLASHGFRERMKSQKEGRNMMRTALCHKNSKMFWARNISERSRGEKKISSRVFPEPRRVLFFHFDANGVCLVQVAKKK